MKNLILLLLACCAFSTPAEPIPGKDLFKNVQTRSVIFSPNTQYVVGEFLLDGKQVMILRDPKRGKSFEVLNFEKAKNRLTAYQWIDNNSLLIDYTLDKDKHKAIVDLNWQNDELKPKLTRIKAEGYLVDPLQDKDDTVLFANKGADEAKHYNLYTVTTVQLANNDFSQAAKLPNPLENAIIYVSDSRNNRLIAVTLDEYEAQFWFRNKGQLQWTKMGNINLLAHNFHPIGLLDDHTLAVLSNEKTDLMSLVAFDLNSQKYGDILFSHASYDLTDAQLNQDGKGIEYVRYFDHGKLVTHYFDQQDRYVEKILNNSLPGKQFFVIDQKAGYNNKLLFVFASNDPGSYYLYNGDKNELIELGHTLPDIDKNSLVKSEVFSLQTDENTQVEAILSKPPTDANGVLLVMPHGGPIGVREVDTFDREVQFLASRGYAVLKVNFRGSSGFGKNFQASGVGQLGRAIEQDITAVVDEVRSKYTFKHLCSIGASYGGYSAMMLAMQFPDLYQCVISRYGVYDLPFIFNSSNVELTEEYQQAFTEVLGDNNKKLADVSPFYIAEKLKSPLLLIAGKNDEIAWFEQSNRIKYRLKQLNKDFEYLFYNGVGHGHHNYYGDQHEFAYIDRFIRKHLKLPPAVPKDSILYRDELMILADVYQGKGLLDKDDEKAVALYQQAAELGDERAVFNMASYYHRGDGVEKDLKAAAKWYQKASDANDQDASFRLGTFYREDELGEPNYAKSVQMFQLAVDQGHKLAYLEVAVARCIGKGIEKDLKRCIRTLKEVDKTNEKAVKRKEQIVANLFWSNEVTHQDKQHLKAMIAKEIKTDRFDVGIELDDYGLFGQSQKKNMMQVIDNKYYPINYYYHKTSTTTVKLDGQKQRFGASFDVDPPQGLDENTIAVVKVRWTIPYIEDGKVIHNNEKIESLEYFRPSTDNLHLLYHINSKWQERPGNWTLEVETLNDQKVFKKTFRTIVVK